MKRNKFPQHPHNKNTSDVQKLPHNTKPQTRRTFKTESDSSHIIIHKYIKRSAIEQLPFIIPDR